MNAPLISQTWTDHVSGRRGFLVVDRLVRGVSSGGLRMREGCTLDEVAGLARGMTMKEALHYNAEGRYIPLGGAKGGSTATRRTPRRTAFWCATCARCVRTSRPSGRPVRTSA